jgi:hypothetical protein
MLYCPSRVSEGSFTGPACSRLCAWSVGLYAGHGDVAGPGVPFDGGGQEGAIWRCRPGAVGPVVPMMVSSSWASGSLRTSRSEPVRVPVTAPTMTSMLERIRYFSQQRRPGWHRSVRPMIASPSMPTWASA